MSATVDDLKGDVEERLSKLEAQLSPDTDKPEDVEDDGESL